MRGGVTTVFFKEMRDILRDRKTLLLMILLPIVVVPLLLNSLISFVMEQQKEAETEVLEYVIFGEEHAPDLARAFAETKRLKKTTIESQEKLVAAIRSDEIDFGIVIPENAASRLAEKSQATVELHFDNASSGSRVESRVDDVVDEYNEELTKARLIELGVTSSRKRRAVLEPVRLSEKGTGDIREVLGDNVGGMLPYFLAVTSAGATMRSCVTRNRWRTSMCCWSRVPTATAITRRSPVCRTKSRGSYPRR